MSIKERKTQLQKEIQQHLKNVQILKAQIEKEHQALGFKSGVLKGLDECESMFEELLNESPEKEAVQETDA